VHKPYIACSLGEIDLIEFSKTYGKSMPYWCITSGAEDICCQSNCEFGDREVERGVEVVKSVRSELAGDFCKAGTGE
jgi:hypothetical protein